MFNYNLINDKLSEYLILTDDSLDTLEKCYKKKVKSLYRKN